MDLKTLVRHVPDFPIPGILFRDITPLLQNPAAVDQALREIQAFVEGLNVDAIVAIEARGFLLGAPLADRLNLPLVPIRKPGKLPGVRMTIEYALEYGQNQLDIHADALTPGQRVVVVDDLIATGGTAQAAGQLVNMLGAEVAGFAFLIELTELDGRARLGGHNILALISD
jgi:adenine phosphoribosyltransferase